MKSHATRFFSLVLTFVMCLSLAPAAGAAESGFPDVQPEAWYYDDVMACAGSGIVSGFDDGWFHPDESVTTVQFLVMLTRTFYNGQVEAAKATETSSWYAPNVKAASDLRISNGLTINENPMSRYDMALILYNILAVEGKAQNATKDKLDQAIASIKDWNSVPKNRQTGVKYCYALGIITGTDGGNFAGDESMTRAQACTVIVRMLRLINDYNPGGPDNNQDDDDTPQVTGTLANGQPATVENVVAIMDEIRQEYPTGTIWGPQGTPENHWYADGPSATDKTRDVGALNSQFRSSGGANTSLRYGCGGFMAMVSERVFGKTGAPCREVTDVDQVRPGDLVITFNTDGTLKHCSIVRNIIQTSVGTRFQTCDGNGGGKVRWSDDVNQGYNNVSTTCRVFTRYPEEVSK